MKWINVKELKVLGLDEHKAIGMMRLDWLGSRKDEVCNQWFPDPMYDSRRGKEFSCQQLQHEINKLIFDELGTFEKVIQRCEGKGYDHEVVFKVEGKDLNYFIRLVPVQSSYSYIFVYFR